MFCGEQCETEFQMKARSVGPPTEVPWVSIDGGTCHSAAIKKDATLYCWGKNDSGQCGRFSWKEKALDPDVLDRDYVKQGLPFPVPVDIWEPREVSPPGARSSWEVCLACSLLARFSRSFQYHQYHLLV
jgi:alpha-tubulin suppressor-like RCC1 family protein